MKNTRFVALIMVLLLLCGLLAACGAASAPADSNKSYYGAVEEVENGMVTEDMAIAETVGSASAALPENQKLVRTIRISAETEALDETLSAITTRINELAGYVQEQNVYNGSAYSGIRSRSAGMVIRIPAEKLDEFVAHISQTGNVISRTETTENITLSYVAVESRIKALETEQARLLELLAMAQTMEDLLKIESRLTEVRTELEQVNSQLRLYDNQVSYGTIHLNLTEVRDYTVVEEPQGFFARIGNGIVNGFKNMGIFLREFVIVLFSAIPYLLLPAAIVALVLFLVKRKKRTK